MIWQEIERGTRERVRRVAYICHLQATSRWQSASCPTPLDALSTWHTLPCRSARSSFFVVYFTTLAVSQTCRMTGQMINCKGLGRRRSWSCQGSIPEFSRSDWGKRRRSSVRIAIVMAGIRNRHLACKGIVLPLWSSVQYRNWIDKLDI